MEKVKEYWQNLSDKTKKMLIAIVAGTAVIAIIGVLALYLTQDRSYSTLFTGLSQEEAQEVVSLLQEQNIDYTYSDKNGSIKVPTAIEEQTRVQLLSQGYPKSGFAYDMYLDNTGLMATESDKKQMTLYDLQDRLGATIRLFSGVQDAKVTIAKGAESKYALGDETSQDASASVVVTMKSGNTLTSTMASAIKNLISTSVEGLHFTNVGVFDADTMVEVSADSSDSSYSTASDLTELTTLVENNIAGNIRRVLEKLYGTGKVAISVKGTLNMDRMIQETTEYSTPEKIDENDKAGLLYQESASNETSNSSGTGTGGVVGTESNSETPTYTNNSNSNTTTSSYVNDSATREWLYNTVKEQREVNPGVLEDATVSVVIDTDDMSIGQSDLLSLVANAAGIDQTTAADKITIIRALSVESQQAAASVPADSDAVTENGISKYLPFIIAGVVVLVLLLILLLVLMLRKKKKNAEDFDDNIVLDVDDTLEEDFPTAGPMSKEREEALRAMQKEDDEMEISAEMLNLRMQHTLKLKQNIGEFIEQNPQIAAKLVQTWLRGEEGGPANGGTVNGRKSK